MKRVPDRDSFAYSSLAAGSKGTPSEVLIYLLCESEGRGKIISSILPWLTDGKNLKDLVP